MTDNEDVGLTAALRIFGDRVRRSRQSSRWTFYSLSEKTGIEIAALSAVEGGIDSLTEIEREKLCDFLWDDIEIFSKILRTERIKAANNAAEMAGELRAGPVVDLMRYRETWQKTSSHPEE
jgi:transcriptional regulator with XRE-family HTH domain